MSRFHIGQDVYVGYAPDRRVPVEARRFRCNVGEIVGGRYGPDDEPNRTKQFAWMVNVDGQNVIAAELLLTPFNPPDREVDIEQCLELTE